MNEYGPPEKDKKIVQIKVDVLKLIRNIKKFFNKKKKAYNK